MKGHAGDEMVRMDVVEQVDKDGNDRADEAADLGSRHVDASVMDARRLFSQTCHVCTLLFTSCTGSSLLSHSVVVNDDDKGGTRNARFTELLGTLLGFFGQLIWHDIVFFACAGLL